MSPCFYWHQFPLFISIFFIIYFLWWCMHCLFSQMYLSRTTGNPEGSSWALPTEGLKEQMSLSECSSGIEEPKWKRIKWMVEIENPCNPRSHIAPSLWKVPWDSAEWKPIPAKPTPPGNGRGARGGGEGNPRTYVCVSLAFHFLGNRFLQNHGGERSGSKKAVVSTAPKKYKHRGESRSAKTKGIHK